MNLIDVVNRTRAELDEAAVARLAAGVLEAEQVQGAEMAVQFVGEKRIRDLNREHRERDEVTDVLSFPLEDEGEGEAAWEGEDEGPPRLLGDVVVCVRRAVRQARAGLRCRRPWSSRCSSSTARSTCWATTTRPTPARWPCGRPRSSRGWTGRRSLSQRGGSLLKSFNFAFDGVVYTLRHERNMWVHFGIAALVLVAALFFGLSRLDVVALLVAISFVIIAEMFNTAVEYVVDLVTDEEDPRARIAKDVSAGAVLVAAVNAIAVAYLVFYDKVTSVPYTVLSRLRGSPIDVMVLALVLVILAAVAVKALTGRGTAFRGGLPSVHAAIAFAGWVAVTFVAANTVYALPISAIVLFLALLVAQSRVQAGIHTVLEVGVGAMLGIVITVVIFRLWYL